MINLILDARVDELQIVHVACVLLATGRPESKSKGRHASAMDFRELVLFSQRGGGHRINRSTGVCTSFLVVVGRKIRRLDVLFEEKFCH